MSLDMKPPSKSLVELIRENATTCAITNGASRSDESLFSNPCNEKYQGKEPCPKKLKAPTITPYIPRSRMEKMRAGAIKARDSKMSKETEAAHSTLQLPVVRHADLKDVANMTAKEKNALAAIWSERLLNGRGMLPLRFYDGDSNDERRVNRSIDHFETGEHTTIDGTLRRSRSGGYTFGKVDMFTCYGPSLVLCKCRIVIALGQLGECRSIKMAEHAYRCDGHPDLDILGHTCGNCAKPWLDLGTQYLSKYPNALDGATSTLRKNHHRDCVKREDKLTTTIRWIQLYRIFFPDLYKQKLLNEGEIEVKVASFSTKEIHEGLTRYQADTILPRRSTSELNQFMKDLKDKATMKSLHAKISTWVGRKQGSMDVVLSGNDRTQLEELGYTTERGFLYSKELHKKQLEAEKKANGGKKKQTGGTPANVTEFHYEGQVVQRMTGNKAINDFAHSFKKHSNTHDIKALSWASIHAKAKNKEQWNGLDIVQRKVADAKAEGLETADFLDKSAKAEWLRSRQNDDTA